MPLSSVATLGIVALTFRLEKARQLPSTPALSPNDLPIAMLKPA
jgi:hypothetical protein